MTKGGAFILPGVISEISTVYDFTDEQKFIQKTLREFVANEVIPQSDKIESKEWSATKNLLLKLGELGFLGAEVPEQYGGQGLDKTTSAILAEEMGWQGSLATTVLADTGIGLLPIVLFGTEEQKKRFIPGVVEGRSISAYSLTESGAGSDAKAIKTNAVLREDGRAYVLNGEKIFVTNGGLADFYIVFAKVGDDKEITAFIVERGFLGIEVGKEEHKMGIVGSSTVPLKLTDVYVPRENVLGEVGKGYNIAMNILNLGRFKLGAACLGGSRQCLQESLNYSRERKQMGVTINNFGAIRSKLCRMAALVYGIESVVYRTAGLIDKAVSSVDQSDSKALMDAIREYAAECSIVKVFCSEANYEIAGENIRIHGGNGFMKDYPAERHLRDSVINRIFEGTNEVNSLLVVKELMKRMALDLMREGKKIQAEVMSVPVLSDGPADSVSLLQAELNGAKKAIIASGGTVISRLGMKLGDNDNQETLLLLAQCLINIYVLDSALAVYAKHRQVRDEHLTRYLFNMLLPKIEADIKSLVVLGSDGDTQRTMFAVVRKLMKYTPENIQELNRKIIEHI